MYVTVCKRSVYGSVLTYPTCKVAVGFCKLLGTKTLTSRHLDDIRALGYTITYIPDPDL